MNSVFCLFFSPFVPSGVNQGKQKLEASFFCVDKGQLCSLFFSGIRQHKNDTLDSVTLSASVTLYFFADPSLFYLMIKHISSEVIVQGFSLDQLGLGNFKESKIRSLC